MKELKRLLPYLKRYKYRFLLGLVFVTISNISSTYIPKLVGKTIDIIGRHHYTMNDVMMQIAFILLLTFFSGLFMFLTRRTIIISSREIEYDLRNDLMESFKIQEMSFFHKNPTGSLMAHATNDIPAAREFLGPAIMYSANTLTTFSFALYYMMNLDYKVALLGLIPLPIIAVSTYFIGNRIYKVFKDVQHQYGELTTQAQESISGVHVVRAYNRQDNESKVFGKLSIEYLNKNLKLAKMESLIMPALMVLIGLSQLLVLLYGGNKVINNEISLGTLTQFFIYLEMLTWPVAAIGWVTNLIQRGAASASRLGKLLEHLPDIIDNKNTNMNNTRIEGEVEFKDVSLKYNGNDNDVLNNISFNLKKHKSLGIVGTVGSGKSSLINLLTRLFDSNQGVILIDGKNIKEFPLSVLRKNIAVVPQDTFLFSDTIENNIKFGNPNANHDEVVEVSKKCQLDIEVKTFENSYDTLLGERGITLSGGQKQRVAIARALIKNPKLLILDDALSAVDAHTEEQILSEISKLKDKMTLIVISHRISAIKNCDYIISLENGKIIENGSHDELLINGGMYSNMYNQQQLEEEIIELQ